VSFLLLRIALIGGLQYWGCSNFRYYY